MSKTMDELHRIMEKISAKQKNKTKEEIIREYHQATEELVKEHKLKVKELLPK